MGHGTDSSALLPTPACGPFEFVALRVGRLDLLRGTVRVAEAAPEVAGHLEWGGVKTREARTIRLPRSVAEELAPHLAGRPHDREVVFTAPRGGPLRESKFVPDRFKPDAVRADLFVTREVPGDGPDRRVLGPAAVRPAAHGRVADDPPGGQHQGGAEAARPRHGQHHPGHHGHLFPDELEGLASRLEDAQAEALASLARIQRGPGVVLLREEAGQ